MCHTSKRIRKRKKKLRGLNNQNKQTTYLPVEETVEQSHKESLERGEKVGRIGPKGELDD
jgi:hypothetical protein